MNMKSANTIKHRLHSGARLCWAKDYLLDGEEACREVYLFKSGDGPHYTVLHCDFLEKFVDVTDLYLMYETFAFTEFEHAVKFIEERFGLTADDLPGKSR